MHILGISALFHDAAAAVITDGTIVAAAQEERFTRVKHDADMPVQAMAFALEQAGVAPGELDAVVFYEKPVSTLSRIFGSSLQAAPRGFGQFRRAMPSWLRHKLWVRLEIERALEQIGHPRPAEVLFSTHHESHAASAFYASSFSSAATICFDGVGEWATTSIGHGHGHDLEIMSTIRFPHSLGLLYSAVTQHCGFQVNDGEYKLMGLAPYGEPTYVDDILTHLVELHDDGSFSLRPNSFGFITGTRMTNRRFEALFGGPARRPDEPISTRELDLARSIQQVTEEVVLGIARHAADVTGEKRACLAGGVALNCVSNARLREVGPFDEIWVQPAAGDAGGAIGAALHHWHAVLGNPRTTDGEHDAMRGSFLGPSFTDDEIGAWLGRLDQPTTHLPDVAELAAAIAERLAAGQVVALFHGAMEFGPRALGHRSILADPRDPRMQRRLNLQTKRRESFRPFAPAVLAEAAADWFDLQAPDPYMTFTAPVRGASIVERPVDPDRMVDLLGASNSPLPAVTHVDGSARVQTVDRTTNPMLHAILTAFDELTGCPVLINTSFNRRDEPIVCTPSDALRCYEDTDIDVLVLEHHLVERSAALVGSGERSA